MTQCCFCKRTTQGLLWTKTSSDNRHPTSVVSKTWAWITKERCAKEGTNYESLRWHRKTRQHILCNCRGLAAAATANWRGGTSDEAPKKHVQQGRQRLLLTTSSILEAQQQICEISLSSFYYSSFEKRQNVMQKQYISQTVELLMWLYLSFFNLL